jgi:hypothetical protein
MGRLEHPDNPIEFALAELKSTCEAEYTPVKCD